VLCWSAFPLVPTLRSTDSAAAGPIVDCSMSDLSRLNPTPHAIAVYASRPLSPVATQHSLPSGRYPLLGPDFHRLDRTSLRLAHSLDHLVGAGEPCRWDPETYALAILEDQAEQEMHVAAVGSAFRRLGSIGSPHLAQVRYVPSDIRFRAALI